MVCRLSRRGCTQNGRLRYNKGKACVQQKSKAGLRFTRNFLMGGSCWMTNSQATASRCGIHKTAPSLSYAKNTLAFEKRSTASYAMLYNGESADTPPISTCLGRFFCAYLALSPVKANGIGKQDCLPHNFSQEPTPPWTNVSYLRRYVCCT